MKVIARHKWVAGATITESVSSDGWTRRFTATIRGYRSWKIWEGDMRLIEVSPVQYVIDKVKEIRNRIDANDESVFVKTI